LNEAAIISSLPLKTVKFHQLQIIKGTAIEEEYLHHPGDFVRFSLDEYVDFIARFVERLNPELIIERFTSEVPPRYLSQEPWSGMRSDQIIALVEKKLEERDTWQGKLFYPAKDPQPENEI
jgi:radical SAM superfamily enzyme